MIKTIAIALALSVLLNTSCNKEKADSSVVSTLNLKDFGIENTNDATPVVVEAIKKCKKDGISKLEFPKGIYHFYPTFAPDMYCAITNNDNGLKRTAFPIIDFDKLEIDGNGSEFIFHGKMIPFIIEGSKNITVKNLSINWDVPFYLQGKVVANNIAEKSFDIEVSTPYKVQYGHLYMSLEREISPYEEKYGFRFAMAEGYDLQVGQNILWDQNTMAPLYNTGQFGLEQHSITAEEIKKGLIRLKGHSKEVPPVGSVFCSKGEYLSNRMCPAFRLFKSKDLVFNNINVHHAGAMGLIAERCENITLDSFNVVLKEGEGRMVTTTADATHFCNVKGEIIIRNSTFENMLDDATNIHGTYVRVNKIIDDYSVAVETYHPHQNDYLFGEVGDSIRIINNYLNPTTGNLVLKNVERINEKISILTFNESVKGKVEKYFGIENVSWYPTALLENNIVRNNRARSFLISVPRKVVVRNNYFSSQMAALRITGDLGLWNESGPVNNLLIEKNIFENCLYGGNGPQSVIMIDPQYDDMNNLRGKYGKDIIIKNNQFKTFDASILKAISVEGLVFEGNNIEQTNTYAPIFPEIPNLKIINCSQVKIENNTYKSISGKKGTLSIDKRSTQINIFNNNEFISLN
jgi:hypothetical protein